MQEKYYKISEEELIELLADSCKLAALENGRVDDWSWYGDSIRTYLQSNGFESMYDLAKVLLSDYVEVI